ncbi:hypothetical protein EDC04DRAFT_3097863 [Pisolithus marmoratus]|nr:hypothetical protein EDC04DRAFT_3097863 [Pisolithus marmoratus]
MTHWWAREGRVLPSSLKQISPRNRTCQTKHYGFLTWLTQLVGERDLYVHGHVHAIEGWLTRDYGWDMTDGVVRTFMTLFCYSEPTSGRNYDWFGRRVREGTLNIWGLFGVHHEPEVHEALLLRICARSKVAVLSLPYFVHISVAPPSNYLVPESTLWSGPSGPSCRVTGPIDEYNIQEDTKQITLVSKHGGCMWRSRATSFCRLALLSNLMVLLLGEATSTKVVKEALARAAKGRTMIAIAHRFYFIKDGRVSEASTDDEASRIERRLERNMFSCSHWVILSNLGGASTLGTVGGAIWHGIM